MGIATIIERLKDCISTGSDSARPLIVTEFRSDTTVTIDSSKLFGAMKCLKEECGFDMLTDVTAVDYLNYPDAENRYGIIYCLTNIGTGERVVVRTFVNDPAPRVRSVCDLWKGANWMEREVYDLFGIDFEGHPDLRRILMPEGFESYPLRKDYPLRGRYERHNFDAIPRSES